MNLEYNIFSMITIGERIKVLRENNNMNQVELAVKIGLTAVAISSYENERTLPSVSVLNKIADLFDVSVDYLLGRVDDPKPYGTKLETLPSYLKLLPVYLYIGKEKIDISNFLDRKSLLEYGTINESIPADYGIKILKDYPIFLSGSNEGGIIWIDEKGKDRLYTGIFVATIIDNKLSIREVIKDVETGGVFLISLVHGEVPIIVQKENINSYVNSYIIGRVFAWTAFLPTEEVSNHK